MEKLPFARVVFVMLRNKSPGAPKEEGGTVISVSGARLIPVWQGVAGAGARQKLRGTLPVFLSMNWVVGVNSGISTLMAVLPGAIPVMAVLEPRSMISRAAKYLFTKLGLTALRVSTILSICPLKIISMMSRISFLICLPASVLLMIA